MGDDFYLPPEAKAYQAFLDWLASGRKTLGLFEQEGIPVPPTLRKALLEGIGSQDSQSHRSRRTPVRPPDRPDAPSAAKDDWLWIPASSAGVRTAVLAVLNGSAPLPMKEIIQKVKSILPDSNEGSISNTGTYLNGKKLVRAEGGWKLKEGETAPILYKDNIWGPREVFQKPDLAAFRRMAIKHLLRISPDGLQIMQVYRQLKDGASWLHTPLSKDLVKEDILLLDKAGEVKQQGNSKKWTTPDHG